MAALQAQCDRLLAENAHLRETEERLRESEEFYRNTVELSQQLVWMTDADGVLRSVNQRLGRITGAADGSDLIEGWHAAIHPDDALSLRAAWGEAVRSGAPFETLYRMRVADGSYRLFAARAAPRRDAEGRVVRWYGVTEDVNERHQAELALRSAEERYRLAVQATNDAIWDYDLVNRRIVWNDASGVMFGYRLDPGPTPHGWWTERVHPDDRVRVSGSFERALHDGSAKWAEHYRFRDASGEYRDTHDRGFIVRDRTGRPVRAVGAMSDVTERRQSEARLKSVQAELIHVSRLSAMGALASTLAHELNQPLTAITNYLGGSRRLVAKGSSGALPAVREALEAAEDSVQRAGRIVRSVRELVSRGSARTCTEDLARIVEDANVLAFVDAEHLGITYGVHIDPAARQVEADRVQLQQVIINLVRNAVQAMADCPRREILIAAEPAATGMVEVSVADTGTGLPLHLRDALFSPFQGTKEQGMGIGLSICRTIVEAHGGRIWTEDRPGGGATFRFTIPVARRRSEEG